MTKYFVMEYLHLNTDVFQIVVTFERRNTCKSSFIQIGKEICTIIIRICVLLFFFFFGWKTKMKFVSSVGRREWAEYINKMITKRKWESTQLVKITYQINHSLMQNSLFFRWICFSLVVVAFDCCVCCF